MSYVLVFAALVAYYIIAAVIAWYPLRRYKGPLTASFSYLWMARTAVSGRAWKIHIENTEKYPDEPLIRIGPDVLITHDPEIIRRINSARSAYRRSQWYSSFRSNPYTNHMLSTIDEDYHSEMKSRTAPAYTGREVPTLESDMDNQLAEFKNLIRKKYLSTASGTKPMDLAKLGQYFTLDIITKLAFGQEWGFVATESDVHGIIESVRAVGAFIQLCCDVPWMQKLVFNNFVMGLIGPKPTDAWGFGRQMGIAKEAAEKAFADGGDPQTMLGSFIRHGLTLSQCEAETPLVVIAGGDTSAAVVRATLLFIMTTPHVYQRLQVEIDEAVRAGKVSSPISVAEAKTLPYLQAVILEGMRIAPPNQVLLPKVVPTEGDTLLGKYFVPGGTRIAVNTFPLLRHKPTFGEDSHVFRPERWLEASPEKRTEMDRGVDLIFGYGRYMCAGKTVAMMELSKVYFELLRDFDFQIINPREPWKETQYAVFIFEEMWVRVTERSIRD